MILAGSGPPYQHCLISDLILKKNFLLTPDSGLIEDFFFTILLRFRHPIQFGSSSPGGPRVFLVVSKLRSSAAIFYPREDATHHTLEEADPMCLHNPKGFL
jgi:hypothetical protein